MKIKINNRVNRIVREENTIMRKAAVVILSVAMFLSLIPILPSPILGMETESYAASNSKGQEVANLALKYQGKTYTQVRTALKNDGYKVWGSTGDWCAWYVSNIARAAGVSESIIPNFTYADGGSKPGFYIWAKGKGLYRPKGTYKPKVGDLALCGTVSGTSYNIYHIEIVTEVNGSTVQFCGGNTGSDNNRSSVVSKSRGRSDVCGYIEVNYPNDVKGTKTIFNGRYHIVSGINNDYCLDVSGASTKDGANVQLYASRMDPKQTWNVAYLGSGYYKITSWNSGKSLDVDNYGTTNGTNVKQWPYSGSTAQQWVIRSNSDGSYSLISRCNGLCLDVNGGKAVNGKNIQMYSDNGTAAQKFYFIEWGGETIQSGRYHIVSKLNETKCLDVYGASTATGANIQLYSAINDPKQTWNVKSMNNGFYKITNYNSGLSLDVHNSGKTNGTNVQQWTDTGVNAQRWIIKRNSDGSFGIISKCNGLYLDVSDGKATNGKNIQMYSRNDTPAQKWMFVEYSNEESSIQNGATESSSNKDVDAQSEDNSSSNLGGEDQAENKNNVETEYFEETASEHEHRWDDVKYIWSPDNKSVTAIRVCMDDNSHKESETVYTTAKITKKATYSAKGQTTYTATFKNNIFKEQKKTVTNINQLQKKVNTLAVKVKKPIVKHTKLKKKAQIVLAKNAFVISGARGRVSYKKISGNKKISINSAGKITIKKGLKKGNYKLKVRVVAAGDNLYKSGNKTVTLVIRVK